MLDPIASSGWYVWICVLYKCVFCMDVCVLWMCVLYGFVFCMDVCAVLMCVLYRCVCFLDVCVVVGVGVVLVKV